MCKNYITLQLIVLVVKVAEDKDHDMRTNEACLIAISMCNNKSCKQKSHEHKDNMVNIRQYK